MNSVPSIHPLPSIYPVPSIHPIPSIHPTPDMSSSFARPRHLCMYDIQLTSRLRIIWAPCDRQKVGGDDCFSVRYGRWYAQGNTSNGRLPLEITDVTPPNPSSKITTTAHGPAVNWISTKLSHLSLTYHLSFTFLDDAFNRP